MSLVLSSCLNFADMFEVLLAIFQPISVVFL